MTNTYAMESKQPYIKYNLKNILKGGKTMKNKMIITVEGGIIQTIQTNCVIEIVVIDKDDQSEDQCLVEQHNPDEIEEKLSDLYIDQPELQDKLKEFNF